MWKDILKNQMNVAGLSMRSMDLDNIIEEDEESCKKRLRAFFDKIRSKERFGNITAEITDDMKGDFIDAIKEDVACNIIDELMHLDKSAESRLEESAITKNGKDAVYEYSFRGLETQVVYSVNGVNPYDNIYYGLSVFYVDTLSGIGLELDILSYKLGESIFKFIKENL